MSIPAALADHAADAVRFEAFVRRLSGCLARPRAQEGGRALSLKQYLDVRVSELARPHGA